MAILRRPGHVIYTGWDRIDVEVLVDGQWYAGELRAWDLPRTAPGQRRCSGHGVRAPATASSGSLSVEFGRSGAMSVVVVILEHVFEKSQNDSHEEPRNRAPRGYAKCVYTSSLEEQAALVDLLRTRPRGMGWTELAAEIRYYGGPQAVLEAIEPDALFPTPARVADLARARDDVRAWAEEGLSFLTIMDDRYPGSIKDIHQAPPFLFTAGELIPVDPAVSVVGSRDASSQGLKMATAVARALVDIDVSVASGLARGIDAAAHRATLKAGGRPVGVVATGLRRQYPAEHRELHADVAEHGLLLSQFWPDAPPQKHNFLMRNATMSGYGIATVVIEAGEHSGARAQARMAVEHGRPVILSDLVVARTQWAAGLLGRPGVHVANGTTDVMRVVEDLLAAPKRVDQVLDSLVAS